MGKGGPFVPITGIGGCLLIVYGQLSRLRIIVHDVLEQWKRLGSRVAPGVCALRRAILESERFGFSRHRKLFSHDLILAMAPETQERQNLRSRHAQNKRSLTAKSRLVRSSTTVNSLRPACPIGAASTAAAPTAYETTGSSRGG